MMHSHSCLLSSYKLLQKAETTGPQVIFKVGVLEGFTIITRKHFVLESLL